MKKRPFLRLRDALWLKQRENRPTRFEVRAIHVAAYGFGAKPNQRFGQ